MRGFVRICGRQELFKEPIDLISLAPFFALVVGSGSVWSCSPAIAFPWAFGEVEAGEGGDHWAAKFRGRGFLQTGDESGDHGRGVNPAEDFEDTFAGAERGAGRIELLKEFLSWRGKF